METLKMGDTTILWCHKTFNGWIGCQKVSPACDNRYAENLAHRFHPETFGAHGKRYRTSEANWKQPLRWNRQAKKEGRRYRVFCGSLCDVFDSAVDPQWRSDLLDLIDRTPNLTWLLLTKRIGNVERLLNDLLVSEPNTARWRFLNQWLSGKPPENVRLGITVCNQPEADRDIIKLLQIPAEGYFVSLEPLLGAIDLTRLSLVSGELNALTRDSARSWRSIDWVIVGGKARPLHPEWVRSIRDQCQAAGVPFHFKQWGRYAPCDETEWREWKSGNNFFKMDIAGNIGKVSPNNYLYEDGCMQIVSKTDYDYRMLDGNEYLEFPT
jgi:protein gp37